MTTRIASAVMACALVGCHESQSRDQFFVVYPDSVRIRQLDNSKSVADAVTANARLRLAHNDERIEHQRQRVSELALATQSAFAEMGTSETDVVLVAWFDTVGKFSSAARLNSNNTLCFTV